MIFAHGIIKTITVKYIYYRVQQTESLLLCIGLSPSSLGFGEIDKAGYLLENMK